MGSVARGGSEGACARHPCPRPHDPLRRGPASAGAQAGGAVPRGSRATSGRARPRGRRRGRRRGAGSGAHPYRHFPQIREVRKGAEEIRTWLTAGVTVRYHRRRRGVHFARPVLHLDHHLLRPDSPEHQPPASSPPPTPRAQPRTPGYSLRRPWKSIGFHFGASLTLFALSRAVVFPRPITFFLQLPSCHRRPRPPRRPAV
ncbi:hypothetical protein K523DRAFT_392528, partial [Schizophyllum commune Tattone D]